MTQLKLFEDINSTSGRTKSATASAPAAPLPARWTAAYRCMRGGWYFRFYWQQTVDVKVKGKKQGEKTITRHLHIRGGNVNSTAAIANRAIVDAAIADGATVEEIKRLILSCKRSTGNHQRSPNP